MYRLALATLAILVAGCGSGTDPALEAAVTETYQAAQAAHTANAVAGAAFQATRAEAQAVAARLSAALATPAGDQLLDTAALHDVATAGLEATAAARQASIESDAAHLAAWHADIANAEAWEALVAADGLTSAAIAYGAVVAAGREAVAALELRAAAGVDEWDAEAAVYTALLDAATAVATADSAALYEAADAELAARAEINRAVAAWNAADADLSVARVRFSQAKESAIAAAANSSTGP